MYKIRIANFLKNNISYIGTALSFSALTFQVTVLNPWHYKLDKKFDKIIKLLDKK